MAMVFNWLISFLDLFWKLWDRVDESTKHEVIEVIVKTFDGLFRRFYQKTKSNDSNDKGDK